MLSVVCRLPAAKEGGRRQAPHGGDDDRAAIMCCCMLSDTCLSSGVSPPEEVADGRRGNEPFLVCRLPRARLIRGKLCMLTARGRGSTLQTCSTSFARGENGCLHAGPRHMRAPSAAAPTGGAGKVRVAVSRAVGLKAADKNGLSDPVSAGFDLSRIASVSEYTSRS